MRLNFNNKNRVEINIISIPFLFLNKIIFFSGILYGNLIKNTIFSIIFKNFQPIFIILFRFTVLKHKNFYQITRHIVIKNIV